MYAVPEKGLFRVASLAAFIIQLVVEKFVVNVARHFVVE